MHTDFALLCFVVVIHWLIFPYPSGLLHWHCGNLTIAPVPAKQPWWIWINTSCEFIMNDCITTTKQSTTKPCAYFLGYTVPWIKHDYSYEIYPQIKQDYMQNYYLHFSVFLVDLGQLVVTSHRKLYLTTSNPITPPPVNIKQDHFSKSFEAPIAIVECGDV